MHLTIETGTIHHNKYKRQRKANKLSFATFFIPMRKCDKAFQYTIVKNACTEYFGTGFYVKRLAAAE